MQGPWLQMGDFNDVRYHHEKIGRENRTDSWLANINLCIQQAGL